MKSLGGKFLCCNYKLYKVGLFIGFIYLIPNLIIVAQIFGNGADVYPLAIMCTVTVLTSLLLIKGLIQEKHYLLLPWMANIGVLIIFNIILFMLQFDKLNREDTKESFYLQFGFFICLELQILFWYIIYTLLMRGYQKSKILNAQIKSVSQVVEGQTNGYYKVNLMASDHLMGGNKVACV